jgi:1-acyl-sn-glycerol-3-phosphate acyltransferase
MLQLIGHLARWTVRRLVRLYYPKIEISGREHIPRTGPVLLAANHANSLIDPVIVGLTADRPVRFFAKAPLFDTPVLGRLMRALGMLPAFRAQDDGAQVRRNLESLNVGAQALAQGAAVGIFPEGKSHDSLKMEQIRSGAARMAVAAVEQGAKELKLVPIGINYQRKTLFRSAIWVRVGRPITVARFVAQHGGERQAMRALTTEIEARLKRVVLHLTDPQLEPFLDELELLVPPPKRLHGHVAISAVRQRKRLADAMNYFHERDRSGGQPCPPDAATPGTADMAVRNSSALATAIQDYRAHLAAAGLNSRSPVMRHRTWRLFATLLVEGLWLGFWFPAAIIGTVFHVVPFIITRALARKIQDGPTTTALSRLGLGLPIYAAWYAGAWFSIRSYFLPWVAWTVVGLMPLAGIFALTYAHRARDICRNWWNQMLLILKPQRLRELRTEQGTLREKLREFVGEYAREFPSLDEQPRRYSRTERVRFTLRWAGIVIAAAGIFIWQNWRFNESGRGERMHGLNLAGLSTNSLAAALQADETALSNIVAGVESLETRTLAIMKEFASGKRNWYRQADDDAVRAELLAYVNYRAALLRIVWKYQDYEHVGDETLRLRAFLASYTAASVLYEASVKFVTLFANAPDAVRKLNEAEPLWNIPPGLFDTVRGSLADPENRRLMQRAQAFYRLHRDGFARLNLTSPSPFDQFHAAIAKSEKTIQQSTLVALSAGAATPFTEARDTGKEAIYRAQMFISSWVGDTKVREPHGGKSLIRSEHLNELTGKLKPGDLMLERRNWFLSNAFLPGYWPHAALYVGTAEDLRRLGLDRDPRVRKHWEKFLTRDDKGHERVIIEAISEGVVFTSMEHSVGEADAAAFLRPNLSEERIKEVIARAFSHAGKPYDFEFDFFSTDKLVCSEVVYRAFDGDISLPLVNVMGRKTLPPIEIVRQCVRERNLPPEQFTFVAWLHSDERRGRVWFGKEDDFYKTAEWSGLDLAPRK